MDKILRWHVAVLLGPSVGDYAARTAWPGQRMAALTMAEPADGRVLVVGAGGGTQLVVPRRCTRPGGVSPALSSRQCSEARKARIGRQGHEVNWRYVDTARQVAQRGVLFC